MGSCLCRCRWGECRVFRKLDMGMMGRELGSGLGLVSLLLFCRRVWLCILLLLLSPGLECPFVGVVR